MLEFARPAWLLLAAALPWFWWHARSGARPISGTAASVRVLVAALLILAAAGTRVAMSEGDVSVVYTLDRSASMSARAQSRALARVNGWSESMRSGDRAGVVVFGAGSVVERGLSARLRLASVASQVSPGGTELARAIAAARAALPSSGARRVVLLTDGCETAGNALDQAALAASDGIAIDVVPFDDEQARAAIRAVRVIAPETVRVAEPFLVSAELAGRPGGKGELSIVRDGRQVATLPVTLGPDGTGSATIADVHSRGGLYAYRATVRDEYDELSTDEALEPGAIVSVAGAPAVLIASASGRSLGTVLESGGFAVTVVAPTALPGSAAELAPFDAVILDDVEADSITFAQASALARHVGEAGAGLLLLGSARSLDAAGYPSSALGPLLPIDLRPRAGRRSPSMALAFVFDKSGSMADVADGVPKIELARAAAMKLLDVVPPSDLLGVIAFDAVPTEVAPMRPAQDPAALAEALHTLTPGGATSIAAAADMALEWLRDAPSSVTVRRLLLLSDGRTSAADAMRLQRAVQGQRVEVSVVAIGADADREMLAALAQSTGGRAYFPDDLRQLPLLVAREASRSAGGALVEEPFTPRGGTHPMLAGMELAAIPRLNGYVVSAARPGSSTALRSHLDDPILSTWRTGQGAVAVYTADLSSTWSAGFRSWNGFSRLWIQAVRWLHRRVDDERLRLALVDSGQGTTLALEAQEADGRYISGLDVRAAVRGPDGESHDISLAATAPGLYEAPVPLRTTGGYSVSIDAGNGAGTSMHLLRGLFWTTEREQRPCTDGAARLARVAEATGGRILSGAATPFDAPRQPRHRDASRWLTLIALLLFFADTTGPALGALFRRRRIAGPPAVSVSEETAA